ncbi:MAG: type II toxin-antitoxin system RelE/ParE family toxin [Pseudomonadota bacterium]
MKLAWTRVARADRKAIFEYIALHNLDAAENLDAKFSASAGRLLSHPDLGRIGRVEGTRELVPHRNYILVYDIHNDTIRVLRVLHTARRWPPAIPHRP